MSVKNGICLINLMRGVIPMDVMSVVCVVRGIILASLMPGCVFLCLHGLMKLDKAHGMQFSRRILCQLWLGSLVFVFVCLPNSGEGDWRAQTAWFLLGVYFLSSCVTDHLTCQVYDVFQYLGVAAGGYLALTASGYQAVAASGHQAVAVSGHQAVAASGYPAVTTSGPMAFSATMDAAVDAAGNGGVDAAIGVSILLFALLQYVLFMRLYGRADGMAFLVSALAEASLGYDMQMYLLHMILSYLLLSLVQGLKRNIGGKGRLKKPVPFLPYITVGLWMVIL